MLSALEDLYENLQIRQLTTMNADALIQILDQKDRVDLLIHWIVNSRPKASDRDRLFGYTLSQIPMIIAFLTPN